MLPCEIGGMYLLNLGIRLKTLRLNRKWTQQQMADLFNQRYHYNLNKSAISQYENNKKVPDIQVLIELSDFYNVSLDYLLKGLSTNDIILKEQEEEYIATIDTIPYDLEQLVTQMSQILKQNKIHIGNKPLSEKQKNIILYSIEFALYLIKKEQ